MATEGGGNARLEDGYMEEKRESHCPMQCATRSPFSPNTHLLLAALLSRLGQFFYFSCLSQKAKWPVLKTHTLSSLS